MGVNFFKFPITRQEAYDYLYDDVYSENSMTREEATKWLRGVEMKLFGYESCGEYLERW